MIACRIGGVAVAFIYVGVLTATKRLGSVALAEEDGHDRRIGGEGDECSSYSQETEPSVTSEGAEVHLIWSRSPDCCVRRRRQKHWSLHPGTLVKGS